MKLRTLTTLLALAGATSTPFAAHAEGVDEASGTGKGIVGGALLGGELVMVTEAAFKVKPAWAYVVGGVAGGAAGGIGGYFVEQNTDARAPMLMLAGPDAGRGAHRNHVRAARQLRPRRSAYRRAVG
jgi:hypothetical protein